MPSPEHKTATPVNGFVLANAVTTSLEAARKKKEGRYAYFMLNSETALDNLEEFTQLAHELGKSAQDMEDEVRAVHEFKRLDELHQHFPSLERKSDEAVEAFKIVEEETNRIIRKAEFDFLAAKSTRNEAQQKSHHAYQAGQRMSDLAARFPHLHLKPTTVTESYQRPQRQPTEQELQGR